MDNKDFNRDKLLNDILRETAAQKDAAAPRQSAPTPPPRTSEPAQRPASEPAAPRQSQPTASQPAAQAFQPANAQPEPDSNTQTTLFDSAQWEMLSGGETASRSAIEDDPLYADLEGESEPFHPEPVHNNNNASTSAKRPRKKRKQHRIISALIMIIVIIGVSILLSSALIVYGRDLLGINSDSSTKIVTIPQGASMKEIAETLQQADIISKPDFFVFIAGMSDKDKDIKPGDHELRPDMAYETILSELVSKPLDSSLSVSVTFPEGIRLVDAADLLEENNVCDADEFLDHFNHVSKFGYAYEDHLPSFQDEKFYQMEGYLFPDTYTFYQEMDVELVCQKILENFNDKITKDMYDRMDALNVTLDQTITLASMIQAEAGNTEQMATISSVFWNRLNNATEYPLLQSDPTTKYVEEVIKPHSESYNEDLYTSYDTYQCTGLPAGPICNPGIEAIQAALYPDNTNYYFFYSNIDTKETYFAETIQEHEANQKKVQGQQAAAEESAAAEENSEEDSDGTEE